MKRIGIILFILNVGCGVVFYTTGNYISAMICSFAAGISFTMIFKNG